MIRTRLRIARSGIRLPDGWTNVTPSMPAARVPIPERSTYPDTRSVTYPSSSWTVSRNISLSANVEHMRTGTVLRRIGLHSGRYSCISATYRY